MYEQIASNKRRTFLLIAGAVVFLGLIGYAIGLVTASGPAGSSHFPARAKGR